jgi:hypothetical protein
MKCFGDHEEIILGYVFNTFYTKNILFVSTMYQKYFKQTRVRFHEDETIFMKGYGFMHACMLSLLRREGETMRL